MRQSAAETSDQAANNNNFLIFNTQNLDYKNTPPSAAAKIPSRVDNALRAGIMTRPRIWAYFQASKLSTTILYSGPHTLMLEAPLSRPRRALSRPQPPSAALRRTLKHERKPPKQQSAA